MAINQESNPPTFGEVLQFPRNDSYLRDRQVDGMGPPSGGGGLPPVGGGPASPSLGETDVTIATLQTKVQGIFVWLGILTAAFGVAFLFLISQGADTNKTLAEMNASLAAHEATLQSVKDSVDRIGEKVDRASDKKS